MVLQDRCFGIAQSLRNPPAFFTIEYNTAEVVVHAVTLIEAQTVLRDHVELTAKDAERLSVHRVRMARSSHVWPGLVDLGVDGKRSAVDRLLTDDDLAVLVDKLEVGDTDLREVHGQGVQPFAPLSICLSAE